MCWPGVGWGPVGVGKRKWESLHGKGREEASGGRGVVAVE